MKKINYVFLFLASLYITACTNGLPPSDKPDRQAARQVPDLPLDPVQSPIELAISARLDSISILLKNKKDQLEGLHDKILNADLYARVFCKLVDRDIDMMVKNSGGWTDQYSKVQSGHFQTGRGILVGERNMTIADSVMFHLQYGAKLGFELKQARERLLGLVDDAVVSHHLELVLPLRLPDHGSLEEEGFWKLPLVAVITLLEKWEGDARTSEYLILGYFMDKIRNAGSNG